MTVSVRARARWTFASVVARFVSAVAGAGSRGVDTVFVVGVRGSVASIGTDVFDDGCG